MAPLKVIGAGYGRTGTSSLRLALNMLGYKTHHMITTFGSDEDHPEQFLKAFKHPEKPVNWDLLYEGFDAAVDWPTVVFLDRLLVKYPDAKFVLTIRDSESWYNSVKNTIYKVQCKFRNSPGELSKGMVKHLEMIRTVVLDGAFNDLERFLHDKERIKSLYVAHNEWVKQHIPADRLLIMEIGEGWDRLCAFLDKPVPSEPFPRVNSTEEFQPLLQGNFFENIKGLFDQQFATASEAQDQKPYALAKANKNSVVA